MKHVLCFEIEVKRLRDRATDMAHEKTHETRQRADKAIDDLAETNQANC
jgi:hypothetical protein